MLKHAEVVLMTKTDAKIDGFHSNIKQGNEFVHTVAVNELTTDQTISLFNLAAKGECRMLTPEQYHAEFPAKEDERDV